ncbi:MAG: hypothetical protein IKG59_01670 [Firmicutes bacterium]|nr:hypothetical protein [Bacillota bacterium]
MAGAKVQPKNAIRSRLSMEGFLENLSAHFGGELDVSVEMGKKLGRTYFIVRYEAKQRGGTGPASFCSVVCGSLRLFALPSDQESSCCSNRYYRYEYEPEQIA